MEIWEGRRKRGKAACLLGRIGPRKNECGVSLAPHGEEKREMFTRTPRHILKGVGSSQARLLSQEEIFMRQRFFAGRAMEKEREENLRGGIVGE